jgi:hypothetical protein
VTVSALERHLPVITRASRDALSIAGVILLVMTMRSGGPGYDFFAYWSVDPAHPYAVKEGFGAFHYAPPLVWLAGPLKLLPWPQAYWLWFGILFAALVWLARSWALAWLAFPPVSSELFHGNVHLLIAVALVLSLRHPAAYAFIGLSKVTPAVTALWYVARTEWRNFAIAVGSTVLVVVVAFAIAPPLWFQYLDHISSETNEAFNLVPIPLLVRLPIAALIAVAAGRLNRPWLLAPAATLALPLLWIHGLAILVAVTPLRRAQRAAEHRAAATAYTLGELHERPA